VLYFAMKPIVILQFIAGEGPGYILEFLSARGRPMQIVRIDEGEALPPMESMSALVLMGGPMSVNDDLPWIPPVMELVRAVVAEDIPVLGHCLGGQLLAKALGAEVRANGCHEIGWGSVEIANSATAREWFGDAPEFLVFHWHGETFDVPEGATHILRSLHCENQAFAHGPHIGLQCHVEMTEAMLVTWSSSEAGIAEIAAHPGPAVQSGEDIRSDMGGRLQELRFRADHIYSHWCAQSEKL
jgi:GMP synthase-like glutamine amidotransferase